MVDSKSTTSINWCRLDGRAYTSCRSSFDDITIHVMERAASKAQITCSKAYAARDIATMIVVSLLPRATTTTSAFIHHSSPHSSCLHTDSSSSSSLSRVISHIHPHLLLRLSHPSRIRSTSLLFIASWNLQINHLSLDLTVTRIVLPPYSLLATRDLLTLRLTHHGGPCPAGQLHRRC